MARSDFTGSLRDRADMKSRNNRHITKYKIILQCILEALDVGEMIFFFAPKKQFS